MILNDLTNRLDLYMPNAFITCNDNPQNIEFPAFIVNPISVRIKRVFQDRFWYDASFSIVYIPDEDIGKYDTFDLENKSRELLFILETIPIEKGYIRANNIGSEYVDNTLIINVDYQIFVREVKDPDQLMEELKQEFRSVING